MGLFSKRETRADEAGDSSSLVNDRLLSAILNGEAITPEKALTIPAVASAVNRVSTLVAVLPIKLYRRVPVDEKGDEVEVKDDGTPKKKTAKIVRYTTVEVKNDRRTYLLNIDSGDTLDQFAIKRNLAKDYLIDKGGFLYIEKKGTEFNALKYVPPATISAVINDVNPLNKDGQYLVLGKHYDDFNFVSVLRDTDDGFLGKPLTSQIEEVLSTAVSNIIYEKGIVRKGGTKKGFLKSEKELAPEAMEALRTAWRNLYSNSADNVIVLNKGVEFQEASDNSVDLQIDQRKKTLFQEISEVFGIHGTNFDDIFRDAVLPVLEAIESALNKSLLLETEKETHFYAFDKREVTKASLEARYKSYEVASKIGVMTKNEIRDLENLEPIDGLDIVSMNLADVLYDTKGKSFFTPNTGDVTDITDKTKNEEDAK